MLSSLPQITEKKKKRIGRGAGSGRGQKSGRGTTRHQKARQDIPLHFEGGQGRYVKKFPLLRGKGRNKPVSADVEIVTLENLNVFADGATVDMAALIEKKVIKSEQTTVKVLANGNLTKKLTVALPVSQAAREMIEKAGGTVTTS